MKVSSKIVDYIEQGVKIAQLVNIDRVIIDKDGIRGIDENKSVAILQVGKLSKLPFNAIGLNRISTFNSCLALIKNRENFSVDAVVDEKDSYVKQLKMQANKLKVEHRCANPSMIEAPKKINDEFKFQLELDEDVVQTMTKAQSIMDNIESLTVANNDDGVTFAYNNISNDSFVYELSNEVESLTEDEGDKSFSFKYPVRTALILFKNSDDGVVKIGKRGILYVTIQDVEIYLLPIM